jgi:hypothetical protein
MRAHLLNWTFGPAFLGALFASFGCPPPAAPPTFADWLDGLGMVGRFTLFFVAAVAVLLVIRIVAGRLIEGQFDWPQVRLFAAVMLIKVALMGFVFALLVSVYQLAMAATGGWPAGLLAAAVGGLVGVVVGVPAGLVVAALKIPERLGLDKLDSPAAAPDR